MLSPFTASHSLYMPWCTDRMRLGIETTSAKEDGMLKRQNFTEENLLMIWIFYEHSQSLVFRLYFVNNNTPITDQFRTTVVIKGVHAYRGHFYRA